MTNCYIFVPLCPCMHTYICDLLSSGEVWSAQALSRMVPEKSELYTHKEPLPYFAIHTCVWIILYHTFMCALLHVVFQYLSSPESHKLIPELIRFICCVIHPTNEVLASEIIPRWALIGWLISLCQVRIMYDVCTYACT